jgi:hypothetical protein
MKTIANRMIVLAVSAIAFGTVAFGQSRMTAEIPFAFHTLNATLPAGTYEVRETQVGGSSHLVLLRNAASNKTSMLGGAVFNTYRTAANGAAIEFACKDGSCSLRAIRSSWSSLEYATPNKGRDKEKSMAVVSIALKPVNTD